MTHPSSFRGWIWLLALAGTGVASADESGFDSRLLQGNWLQSADLQQAQSVNGTFSTSSGLNLGDPFAVVSSGTLWQDQAGVNSSRPIADNLALDCSSSTTTQDGSADAQGSSIRAETTYQPFDVVTIKGNVHDSSDNQAIGSPETTGAGASLETHLPLDTVFTAAVNSDHSASDNNPGFDVETDAYDAQVQKPLGKLPVNLLLKGHYIETYTPGEGATRLPSFEQSLVWKPMTDTTLQAGLRQQQYQNFPGIDNELNEALFADWSQNIVTNVSWHSYAEMLNTRSTVEIAETGTVANGTTQPTTPNGGSSVTSMLPVSTTDETLTFSTGPSIKLQQDLSASLEYSSSWDQNPAPGSAADEQRVSLSLKGSF
jgi:hypothetical protein